MSPVRSVAPRAWAEIDLAAVAHNVGVVRRAAAPSDVWAVVKADGYGHGAVSVAGAAIAAGCAGLCVALTSEGVALRDAGVEAPILVLSEQPPEDAVTIVANDLTPTVTTTDGIEALAAVGVAGVGVHVKVDTGMHRIGAAPDDAAGLAKVVVDHAPWLRLDGVFTHLAVADEPEDPYTAQQLGRLDDVLMELSQALGGGGGTGTGGWAGHHAPVVHVANSAGALAHPDARRSFVRAGIALYGISPGPGVDHLSTELRPVMSVKARVSFVKRLTAGERVSYGLRHTMSTDANVATVPLGYADGIRRNLSNIGDVLIGGRRRRILGTITMDQLMVDCGEDAVRRGDEVVVLGQQGDQRITAEEWAAHLDTIGYEITCGITTRVPRVPIN